MISEMSKMLNFIYDQIRKETDIAVVGMSGGADSTLCSILAKNALGKENVFGCHMPMTKIDETHYNHNSRKVAKHLEIHSLDLPIESVVDSVNEILANTFAKESLSLTNLGNTRSRMRMTLLYGVCHHLGETHKKRARVIGTGNLSEDFIGYDTKGGDALADLFIIGDLFKSEVYQLLEYFKSTGEITEEMIERTPSAALWEGQTDEQELGYTYNEMELSVRKIKFTGADLTTEVDKFVKARHLAHKHKHEAPKVLELRKFCC